MGNRAYDIRSRPLRGSRIALASQRTYALAQFFDMHPLDDEAATQRRISIAARPVTQQRRHVLKISSQLGDVDCLDDRAGGRQRSVSPRRESQACHETQGINCIPQFDDVLRLGRRDAHHQRVVSENGWQVSEGVRLGIRTARRRSSC